MKHCRWKTWLSTAALVGVLAFLWTPQTSAQIVAGDPGNAATSGGDDVFELEGNVADDPGDESDDWVNMMAPIPGGGTLDDLSNNNNPVVTRTAAEPPQSADPNFPGVIQDIGALTLLVKGGKDIEDIPEWTCRNQNSPPGADLTNAYSIAYDINGDLVAFFGTDRKTTSGTFLIGYWYFQESLSVTCIGDGGDGKFRAPDGSLARHGVGDVLAIIEFLQGGQVGQVRILQWVCDPAIDDDDCGPDPSNLAVVIDFNPGLGQNADCDAVGGMAGDICATINRADDGPFAYPWQREQKGNNPPAAGLTAPDFSLMEGGINLSSVFENGGNANGNTPCFSSFMAISRSSVTFESSQKDFVLGKFEVCEQAATKVCEFKEIDFPNEQILFNVGGIVKNTGFGDIAIDSLTDETTGGFESGPSFFFPVMGTDPTTLTTLAALNAATDGVFDITTDAIGPDEFVIWTGVISNASGGFTNTIEVDSSPASGSGSLATAEASANCPVVSLNPNIDVEKMCAVTLVTDDNGTSGDDTDDFLRVAAAAKITVCNIGQSTLTDVQLTDPDINDGADLLPSNTSLPGGPAFSACGQVSGNRKLTITVPYNPDTLPTNAEGTCRFDNTVTATATAGFLAVPFGNCELDNGSVVCTDTDMAQCDLCPLPTDTDGDNVPDSVDNCVNDANADQADSDMNGLGDVCEPS